MHIGWGIAFVVIAAIIGLVIQMDAVDRCDSKPGWSYSWIHKQCLPDK